MRFRRTFGFWFQTRPALPCGSRSPPHAVYRRGRAALDAGGRHQRRSAVREGPLSSIPRLKASRRPDFGHCGLGAYWGGYPPSGTPGACPPAPPP